MNQQHFSGYAAAFLRISLGAVLLAHGLLKVFVFTLPGTVGFFASQGFPGWMAYPVIAVEILAGAAMIVGLHSRVAAIVSLPVLVGALFVHIGNGWLFTAQNGGWEYPAFLVVTSAVVALLGDGAFALANLSLPRTSHKLRTA
ncbi:DoxX family protein [Noviherbaspirillum saxi]|uniref:DoxX family protein n=1 Tax=Noviherbaspirillum saxi TaxID=2320863 RepID=A0A3A3G959_9BURK|nr:DoxX family protein [Noviherbaspirillum saxi]RJF97419.1 DoxX family protein [Noviherbaspirillum saxi]